jgi:hypothetical protein
VNADQSNPFQAPASSQQSSARDAPADEVRKAVVGPKPSKRSWEGVAQAVADGAALLEKASAQLPAGEPSAQQHKQLMAAIGRFKLADFPDRFVICFNPAQAARDAAVRERLLTQLAEVVTGTDQLTKVERAKIEGSLAGKPGLKRFLRVTPGGLLRIDKQKIMAAPRCRLQQSDHPR